MKRSHFIMTTCTACVGGYISLSVLGGCGATKIVTGSIFGADLIIPLTDFEVKEGNQAQFRRYVIVQNEALQYPICVYRFDESEYKALWMRCTHQGTELQVFGDRLECPAHGSEYDNEGGVLHGPTTVNLKTFPVKIANNQLRVSLK